MKYRVRLDLSFASESDAQTLMACARSATMMSLCLSHVKSLRN